MKFSVAIPAFKPRFFREAVESVLAQSYADWELVIVDDASPDDLRAIAEPFLADDRVRFYRNEANFGAVNVVDNWNRCLEYCTGDYIICMGDDDRLLPNCLSDLCRLINARPGLGVYHIQTQIIDHSGNVLSSLPPRPETETALDMLERRWCKGGLQFIGDFCFEIERLLSSGGFYKTPLAWGADDITVFSAAADGIANTAEAGFQYRSNESSISSGSDYMLKYTAMMSVAGWFDAALSDYTASAAEEGQLNMLRRHLRPYYARQCSYYVVSDIGRNLSSFKKWYRDRQMFGLSLPRLLFLTAKSLAFRLLGRV